MLRGLPEKADRSLFKVQRWVTPDEGEYLAWLVKANRIRFVLESGTANGYSALWMGAMMPVCVYTWDIVNRPKIWEHFAEFAERASDIVFREEAYAYDMPGYACRVKGPRLFFIDGDHEEPWVRKDWENAKRWAEPGDMIVLHDAKVCPAVAELAREIGAESIDSPRGFAVFRA